MGTILQDLRYGLRMLAKSPSFTLVAVLTLALGIGANTAIYSIVNGVLLRPLPFAQPDRLVSVTGGSGWDDVFPQGALVAMQANLKTIQVAGFSYDQQLNLTGVGEPARLSGTAVSANLFSLLGVRPEMGRIFLPGEDQLGRDSVVILSHALWQQKFGSDSNVIGRSVMLEGVSRQIVGVMPGGFQFASPKAQFWVPLHLDQRAIGAYWGGGFMPVIGRLRPGVTMEQARAEVQAYIPKLRGMFPWQMPDALWADASVISLQQGLAGGVSTKLLVLLAAIGMVLLIACVNVANLLLARAAGRQKEMAVRAALGAGHWRICRQLLTESVLLGIAGGALGMLLAMNGLAWLKAILPADTPRLASVSMDWRVMGFTAAISLLAGVIFGLAPALHASKIDLTESLKSGRQRSAEAKGNRLRNVLAIAEVSMAVVLVIGAGLLVKSLWELAHVNPGFRTESIITARVTPDEKYCAQFERCRSFYSELIARVEALPGVKQAAVVSMLPLELKNRAFAADMEGHTRDPKEPAPVIAETSITPDYLQLMGIPLLRGRGFTAEDMAPGAPAVVLVTEATVQKFWPNEDPIGKHVKAVFEKDWITIVGVVGDVNQESLASRLPDWFDGAIYEPYGNGSRGKLLPTEMTLVVRTEGDQANLAGALRTAVASLNPDAPVSDVKMMRTIVSESMAAPRSTMSLFAVFAGLALLLGSVGIYGVISYSVAQRTPEIGIRMALGAQRRDVMRLVMGQGVRLALAGVGIGVIGALAATRVMSSLLFGVSTTDPATFAVVAILLTAVALAASFFPARRAMRVDPMVALRYE
ncbi:MAG TPA: ABC transporter permease [Candidatus Acidoferrales bacterium]|nr:ABC transporter permease [Candidatus Acidoferrales bacterium]